MLLSLGLNIIRAMRSGDLAGVYQAKTYEELLRLAMESDQLTSEAQAFLTRELGMRGISAEKISSFREEENLRRIGTRGQTDNVAPQIVPAPLLSQMATAPPWRPKAAGHIAFFFGPVAGALVVAVSLRRMGHEQIAKKVMLLALGVTAAEVGVLLLIPEFLSRFVAFGAHVAFLLIFPVLMEKEFSEWQATHPNAMPSNGWNAIGWGLVGSVLFLVIAFLVFLGLSALLPSYF
ncbi:MAG: hypothetical protein LAN71_09450 [Acidobacteriia bacterium]|nr:hypothetical protein [Terriglobia bacterium]